jgi:heme o synthase
MANIDLDYSQETSASDGGVGTAADFFQRMKPRVMSLVVFTAFVGLVVAPGKIHPVLAVTAILLIAVGAGASGALNMWYDADIDGRMRRTARRPIPMGRVTPGEALGFGVFLSVFSVVMLGLLINWLAGALLAFTIAFYIFIYTMWLKRRTPYNIVIGGAAGAFPPMIGWIAATGTISVESVVLFMIIFLWTPPHFWALSLYRLKDYRDVGVPMLPVVSGTDETRRQILLYSIPYVAVTFVPVFMGFAGLLYLTIAAVSGVVFLWFTVQTYRIREGAQADKTAKKLFSFSILHLFMIFAVLLIEQGLGLGAGWTLEWM